MLCAGVLAAVAIAALPSGIERYDEPPACAVRVSAEYWHDADTPKRCKVMLPLGVILDEPDGLRASDYDAWEVGTRPGQVVTDDERSKGRAALADLIATFDESDVRVQLNSGSGRDKYGRPLGVFWLRETASGKWVKLADWIKAHGYERGVK